MTAQKPGRLTAREAVMLRRIARGDSWQARTQPTAADMRTLRSLEAKGLVTLARKGTE